MIRTTMALLAVWFAGAMALHAAPRVAVSRQAPCYLFSADAPVRFTVSLQSYPPGEALAAGHITDYFGRNVWTGSVPVRVEAGRSAQALLEIGPLDCGYYELNVEVTSSAAGAKTVSARAEMTSFGVVRFVQRTAAEARQEGARFGLKIFQIGSPGIWWRRPLVYNIAEFVDACSKLGLQWTRHLFNQKPSAEPGVISTLDLVGKHAMNCVMKIEGFPESCFDTNRYGSTAAWTAKKKSWSRCTVPLKEPYQQWLREQIAAIPQNQDVFEIGNEVWNYMSAEEFAEWCRLVVPVVKEVRPGAVIGADWGDREYRTRFIAAGGMQGMNAAFLHPYSFTPQPEHRIRPWLRNLHDTFRVCLGNDLPLYVTEYGWSTAPQNEKYGKTERQQAQRTARESLMLYAEDCKTLIPHWMADREEDPKEREHWFGFFRLKGEPKPVLVAHAVSARMIDCSRFVGDLWLGPGVGAMLFERKGVHTLALWTLDEALGGGRDLDVGVGAAEVTVVDLMGREQRRSAPGGQLSLKVSGDVTYVVGVAPALAQQAIGPDRDLIDGCWNTRSGTVTVCRAISPPQIDASLNDCDWTGQRALTMGTTSTPTEVFLSWDDANLYMALRVRDDIVKNRFNPAATGKVSRITDGDAFELTLCTRPSRQAQSYGETYEYMLEIAPTSTNGEPFARLSNALFARSLSAPSGPDASGFRWAAAVTNGGWVAEAAIPIKLLKGFPDPKPGALLSFQMRVLDVDRDGARPTGAAFAKTEQHMEWPYLELEDTATPRP